MESARESFACQTSARVSELLFSKLVLSWFSLTFRAASLRRDEERIFEIFGTTLSLVVIGRIKKKKKKIDTLS